MTTHQFYDVAAESALVGSCLVAGANYHAIDQAVEAGVTSSTFWQTNHGLIFDAITTIHDAGQAVDAVTVAHELDARGQLHADSNELIADKTSHVDWGICPITRPLLTELALSCPAISNAPTYARLIVGHERDRWIYNQLTEATNGSFANYRSIIDNVATTVDGWDVATNQSNFFEDVMAALEGPLGEPPTIGMRDDDVCGLFYAGQLNNIIGESESGKSLLVQAVAAREILAGNHVFYLDFEKDLPSVVERMMQMGVTGAQLHEFFHYQRREDPWIPTTLARLRAELAELHPTFCVVDGVTNAMKLEGLNINENTEIAKFYGGVPALLSTTGACVTCVDHVTKSRENRAPGGIGGQHKRAGITGSSIEMRMKTPAGRARTGSGYLIVDKDAPGHMRRHAVDGRVIADVTFISNGNNLGVFITASALQPKTVDANNRTRLTGFMERTSKTVEGFDSAGQSGRTITRLTTGEDKHIIAALATLVEEGYVSATVRGNGRYYVSVKPFREDIDRARLAAVAVPVEPDDEYGDEELF